MNNMEIFAARLKNARLIKGFSMDQLASAMNNRVSKILYNLLIVPPSDIFHGEV